MRKKGQSMDLATKHFQEGYEMLVKHPMFSPLAYHASFNRREGNLCPDEGYAVVTKGGTIHIHPKKRATPEEWLYILAHCLLHLGFEHFKEKPNPPLWNIACDVFVAKFLYDMKLGKIPGGYLPPIDMSTRDEESLYQQFLQNGVDGRYSGWSVGGSRQSDMIFQEDGYRWGGPVKWGDLLGRGIVQAVSSAIDVVSGHAASLGESKGQLTEAQRAKNWFLDSYPLLGSLAADFALIEDSILCQRLDISVAAIDVVHKEIYINPAAGLSYEESKFVLAHEYLHAGLCHHERRQGRDPYFWNVACDYVINDWLIEMGIGEFPKVGGLLDLDLKGLNAESIYDRIVTDMRKYRKLYTLRGIGGCDIIDEGNRAIWDARNGISLEDFYKGCLSQGLSYHQEQKRGYLPLGLIEEIKALAMPPIKWDVELAKWFDHHFQPVEKRRTYSRLSRRQSSTPDIPRPAYVDVGGDENGRTFGVILDTSGSMDKKLLAKALGTIASYSTARDVPAVRVVFCDAVAYDAGYMLAEEIAETVKVKGRGGTLLQPGIDLLENAADFPKNGPILVITDGECDRLLIRRKHAFILPKGKHLPFIPKGEVFRIE
jgi:predicted metal-dependent peptidase